jgi:hypothetical protein
MSDSRRVELRPALAALVSLVTLAGGALAATPPAKPGAKPAAAVAAPAPATPTPDEKLLAAIDLFARAPKSFRATLAIGAANVKKKTEFEIWRGAAGELLVRPLDPKEKGKFFLLRGPEAWFLAPGAKQPVRLGQGYRLSGGAALEEITGLRLVEGYTIAARSQAKEIETLELAAKSGDAAWGRIRLAYWKDRLLPLRAELQSKTGKTLRLLEFDSWKDEKGLIPDSITIKDVARGGAPIQVELHAFEPRDVPAALFALDDPSERAKLGG